MSEREPGRIEHEDFILYEPHCSNTTNPNGMIIYAGNGECGSLRHFQLFEEAQEIEIVSENAQIFGGGHLLSSDFSLKFSSEAFGKPKNKIIGILQDHLENISS